MPSPGEKNPYRSPNPPGGSSPLASGGELIPPKGIQLSFAGCGFLGIYHVGVSACLRQCAPHIPLGSIAGASAGAMAGACLLAGADLGVIRSSIVQAAANARSSALGPFSPTFSIHDQLRSGLSLVLPDDAHARVSGRLVVSLTRVCDGQNVLMTHFSSRHELIEALLCSSFIPFFSGLRPGRVRGVRYIDGGVSNNCPITGPATVTVSPFSGEADVCPADGSASMIAFSVTNTNFQINRRNVQRFVHALFPPDPDALRKVCQQGFNDMLDFLQKNGLVSCPRCSKILSLASSTNLKNKADEEMSSMSVASNTADTQGETADFEDLETIRVGSSYTEDTEGGTRRSSASSRSKGKAIFVVSESDFSVTDCGPDCAEKGENPVEHGDNPKKANLAEKDANLAKKGAPHVCIAVKATNHTEASDGRKNIPKRNVRNKVQNTETRVEVLDMRDGRTEVTVSNPTSTDIEKYGDIRPDVHTKTWVDKMDTDTEHLCKDVRFFLDQRPSVLGVCLSESVCRMTCYNCADCRNILQEGLMVGGANTILKVPKSLVGVTFSSLYVLTLPLTRSLGLQYSLIKSLVRLLPLYAVLRLYHFAVSTAAVTAAVLAGRPRSVRDQGTGPGHRPIRPGNGPRRPGNGATIKEIPDNHLEIRDRKNPVRKGDLLKRTHSVGNFDTSPRGGVGRVGYMGEFDPHGLQQAEPDLHNLQQAEPDLHDLQQAEPDLHDLLESSLLSFYYEEGHMTECWALTTLTKMFPDA